MGPGTGEERQPVDRERLIAEFLQTLGDQYAGYSPEQMQVILKRGFRNSLPRMNGEEPLSKEDEEIRNHLVNRRLPFRPLWSNPIEREAAKKLYLSGGIPALNERFGEGSYLDEDRDYGVAAAGMAEYLLPPGAVSQLEAYRKYEYLSRLLDNERELTTSDLALGRHTGGNYARTGAGAFDHTNYFPEPAVEGMQYGEPWGPAWFPFQESSAMAEFMMTPQGSGTLVMNGMDLLGPSQIDYALDGEDPVSGTAKASERIRRLLGHDTYGHLPTMRSTNDFYGKYKQHLQDQKLMNAAEPPAGQDALYAMTGRDDWSEGAGQAWNLSRNMLDLSPLGAAFDTAQGAASMAKAAGRSAPTNAMYALEAAKNFGRDAAVETSLQGVIGAGGGGEWKPNPNRAAERRSAEDAIRKLAPLSSYKNVFDSQTAPMQRMAATNPHIQRDLMNQAQEEYDKRLAREAEITENKASFFTPMKY